MNTATNRSGLVLMLRVGLIVLVLLGVSGLLAQAGSSADRGTLPGTPAVGTINYLTWISTATPPTQVLTEDGYNSSAGPNRGYQAVSGVPNWILNANNFSPAPDPNSPPTINMLFGGISAPVAGTIWTFSFPWDGISATVTNHGQVGTPGSGTCPVMTQGSRSPTGKVINWTSTAASGYAIYRSQTVSGTTPANGLSNGRYDLVTTVPGGTTTYLDTDAGCVTGAIPGCWHIVVPLNSSNQIVSCHSVETNPTVVSLSDFTTSHATPGWPLIVGLGALVVVLVGGLAVSRRRTARG
jgi:hypothetical protein